MISYLNFGRRLVDVLLPPQCLACDALVDEPGRFCGGCFARIGFITEPLCAACGVPLPHDCYLGPEGLCPICEDDRPPWGRARGALRYDTASRGILLAFKHGDRVEHARALAPMMLHAGAALLADAELLVPVPLHRRRLIARRYNQAALLAHAVGRLAQLPVLPDALIRPRPTHMLGKLSATARTQALAGAIQVHHPAAISGRRLLLIDDVLTSGATARACSLALLEGGAAAVDLLVAARVPDRRLE